jgi:two-component system cell cycle response regulator
MGSTIVRVLAVEDNPADLRLLKEQLKEAPGTRFDLISAGTMKEALALLGDGRFDVALLDLKLPDSAGLEGIDRILSTSEPPPVIVLTDLNSEEVALQAIQRNAQEYLVKGNINSDALVRCIRYTMLRDQAEKAVRKLNAELEQRVAEQTAEIRAANEQLEQRVLERTAELQTANENLRGSRQAALNLMNDAILARKEAENLGKELSQTTQRLSDALDKLQRSLEREQQLARTDGLTGLCNSRHFFELAKRELSAALRYQRPLTIIMFDLDDFKRINDSAGHLVGDSALVRISRNASAVMREVDVLARYGGDEFVILLPQTNAAQALQVAERVRASITEVHLDTTKLTFNITLSIGIAEANTENRDETIEAVLQRADDAMYQAKARGRNFIQIYTSRIKKREE